MNKKNRIGSGKRFSLTTVLLLIFGLNCLVLFGRISSFMNRDYSYDTASVIRSAVQADYPSMTSYLAYNRAHSAKVTDETGPYTLLAEYYKRAQLYRAYVLAGDTARAEECHEDLLMFEECITDPDVLECVADLQQRFSVP